MARPLRAINDEDTAMSLTETKLDRIVEQAVECTDTKTQLAVALHDYVRDTIAFGFTPFFDAASPTKTLALGVGHCNPQARLMVELFRRAGFSARFQPVTIRDDVLRGAVRAVPQLSHVFTEVKLGGRWVRLDSYIVDPPLRRTAVAKLKAQSRDLGYGCHVTATGDWDGASDCFSQVADPEMIVEVHDPVDDIRTFYASTAYLHRAGPLSFNMMMAPWRIAAPVIMPILNARIEKLRRQGG